MAPLDNEYKNNYNNIIKNNIPFDCFTSLISLMNIPPKIDN